MFRLTLGRRKVEPAFTWILVISSTIFCAWHVPHYILIIATSIAIDYGVSLAMDRHPLVSRTRNWLLALSVATNLGLLAFFKYADFFLENISSFANFLGFHGSPLQLGLELPMGISFYTFCSMSYTIDVYRGKLRPVRSFKDLYLFLTFFPHLVAGPIVRAEQFLYQMNRTRLLSWRVFTQAGYLLIRGCFLKMVCADNLAAFVGDNWDQAYQKQGNGALAWICVLAYSFQILCDFEGYSNIAQGLAYLLGYRLPLNFNFPYLASSFKNFWERWHISLSQWLRDYLYVPLGGNRGSTFRTYLNLLTVMVLGGLWHGAAMTFLAWGLLHGLALTIERMLGFNHDKNRSNWSTRFLWYAIVQLTVLVTWVFFRSYSLKGSFQVLKNLVAGSFDEVPNSTWAALVFVLAPLGMHVYRAILERGWIKPMGKISKAILAGLMLYAIFTCYGESNEFIYFKF